MSRHYLAMRQAAFQNQESSIDELIKKLAKTRPKLARKLAKLDWNSIIKHVASLSLQSVATKLGLNVKTKYQNGWGGYEKADGSPQRGQVIGVLQRGKQDFPQLGVAIEDGNKLSFFWNSGSAETRGRELNEWKSEVEKAYKEESLSAALKLVGNGKVERTEREDGTVVLETKVKGG